MQRLKEDSFLSHNPPSLCSAIKGDLTKKIPFQPLHACMGGLSINVETKTKGKLAGSMVQHGEVSEGAF